MLVFSMVAAVGIFLLLHTSFGSWRLATLSFLTLPSALVGGVLAAYFGDGVISLGSLVGFLTVLGIAARNGIMMINHFQHLERDEGETFGPELVLRGARRADFADPDDHAGDRRWRSCRWSSPAPFPATRSSIRWRSSILGGLITSTLAQPVRRALAVPALRKADPGGRLLSDRSAKPPSRRALKAAVKNFWQSCRVSWTCDSVAWPGENRGQAGVQHDFFMWCSFYS